jgi:hypothetical protein
MMLRLMIEAHRISMHLYANDCAELSRMHGEGLPAWQKETLHSYIGWRTAFLHKAGRCTNYRGKKRESSRSARRRTRMR